MLLSFILNYSVGINIFVMIAAFILTGIAYYSLAKKRNISKPWIAWIPIVQVYMIGKTSDDINIKYNKKTHRGRWTIIFTIAYLVFSVVAISLIGTLLVSVISSIDFSLEGLTSELLSSSQSMIASLFSGINAVLIITALISGVIFIVTTIISIVFQMISWYSVYNEYDNKRASIYLVIVALGFLLIGGSSILAPIFVLVSSKNPPRFETLNSSSSYQSISSEQK